MNQYTNKGQHLLTILRYLALLGSGLLRKLLPQQEDLILRVRLALITVLQTALGPATLGGLYLKRPLKLEICSQKKSTNTSIHVVVFNVVPDLIEGFSRTRSTAQCTSAVFKCKFKFQVQTKSYLIENPGVSYNFPPFSINNLVGKC